MASDEDLCDEDEEVVTPPELYRLDMDGEWGLLELSGFGRQYVQVLLLLPCSDNRRPSRTPRAPRGQPPRRASARAPRRRAAAGFATLSEVCNDYRATTETSPGVLSPGEPVPAAPAAGSNSNNRRTGGLVLPPGGEDMDVHARRDELITAAALLKLAVLHLRELAADATGPEPVLVRLAAAASEAAAKAEKAQELLRAPVEELMTAGQTRH